MSTHFQDRLPELFKLTDIVTAVETGCSEGVSTKYLLQAMDAQGFGELHTVELSSPKPFQHPKLNFYKGYSTDWLPKIYAKTGPWDLFLHDSDHEEKCQTFEYDYAWKSVRPGGIIATDDSTWGNPPHGAWKRFLASHGLKDQILDNARYVIRP